MKRLRSALAQRKYLAFQKNPQERARFEKLVRQLPLPCILWPSFHSAYFPEEFCLREGARDCIFPIDPLLERVHYSGIKLEELARMEYEELHPIPAYFILSHFENQIHVLGKELGVTTKKEWKSLCHQIQRQKKSLDVPRGLREGRGYIGLCAQLLSEFQNMSKFYTKALKTKENVESELAAFRAELDMKRKQNASVEKLEIDNQDLRSRLKHERKVVTHLEKELRHITERILASHHLDQSSSLVEEHQNLRHEYNLLTRKNDALVSKNIELANSVEGNSRSQTNTLEDILDEIQKRINILLQKEYSDDPEIILRSVQKEILELNRARKYLGRALYNLGILYLRTGDTENARKELKAARELGVTDIKAEKVIAGLS